MSVMIALSGFTDERGATRVIPDSHQWKLFEYAGGLSTDYRRYYVTLHLDWMYHYANIGIPVFFVHVDALKWYSWVSCSGFFG